MMKYLIPLAAALILPVHSVFSSYTVTQQDHDRAQRAQEVVITFVESHEQYSLVLFVDVLERRAGETSLSEKKKVRVDLLVDSLKQTLEDSFVSGEDKKMLLVLAAPSVHNTYYASNLDAIVAFQIAYMQEVIKHGLDDIMILVDQDTVQYYDMIPDEYLIVQEMYDIWMRDFTTVHPYAPVQFTYTDASMSAQASRETQQQFSDWIDTNGLQRETSDLLLDGGNIVDNYAGRVITTRRFLEDNDLSYEEGVDVLKSLLGANQVAIVEPDEDVLAHADGMLARIEDDVLLVNDYSEDQAYRESLLAELQFAFPGVTIVEVPVEYSENKPGEWEGFSSACGVNLNMVLTEQVIYMPVFGMEHEQRVQEIVQQYTSKKLIPIDASQVCAMGGSVRCLTRQVSSEYKDGILQGSGR